MHILHVLRQKVQEERGREERREKARGKERREKTNVGGGGLGQGHPDEVRQWTERG